jgi:chitin synthase
MYGLLIQFLFDVRKGPKGEITISQTDPFGIYGDMVFQILRGLYLFGLVCLLITAMGNRPRGTKWLYRTLSLFFSCLMIMMLFMAVWSIRLSIMKFYDGIPNSKVDLWTYFRTTPEFRDFVVATGTTYGVYVISSIVHFELWHVITSLVPYLLLLPTYTNIFMVYAFANLHDVSWGTKGANTVEALAPAAKKVNEKGETVFEYISSDAEDISESWKVCYRKLGEFRSEKTDVKSKRDEKTKQEDATKTFRTKVILLWIVCNGALVVLFTNQGSLEAFFPNRTGTVNPYLTFLFWSFSALAVIRFCGSLIYMVEYAIEKFVDARMPKREESSV